MLELALNTKNRINYYNHEHLPWLAEWLCG